MAGLNPAIPSEKSHRRTDVRLLGGRLKGGHGDFLNYSTHASPCRSVSEYCAGGPAVPAG